MSHPSNANVGDTISKGIQDVAALLPLLGTDQCERHVGAALESGYIYAAATPLSIFGSLGIVKAAFATYLASVTNGFHGGEWFHNAGFGTAGSGSVIPLVTIVIGTKQYGAECKLEELLKEQHLDDPELVSDVKFFGWEKKTLDEGKKTQNEDSFLRTKFSFSWTFALVLASALFSTISFTPYLYLTHNQWDQPISWLFPALRSIGSMLCVISAQCALQLRIHRIVISSLLLMKSQKHHPRSSEEASNDRQTLMEVRLQKLRGMLAKKTSDKEQGAFGDETKRTQLKSEVEKVLRLDITLLIHQVILLAGMMMIVTGYVGCFNLVNRSDTKYGPYIWLGMETFLSILRMALWGWNPSWAQGDTGLEMKLQLKSTSRHESTRSTETPTVIFPPITTSRPLSQLMKPTSLGGRVGANAPESTNFFIVISAEDFLAAATPYVGPLRRLRLDGISLYHAIIPEEVDGTAKRKLLCLTARPDDSEGNSISLFIRDNNTANTEPYKIFSSHSYRMRGSQTRSLQITLEDEISPPVPGKSALINPETFHLLFQYSSVLFRRLFVPPPVSSIRPLWTLTLPSPPTPEGASGDLGALTKLDEEYIDFRKAEDTMRAVEYTVSIPDVMRGRHPQLAEHAILFMVAILEIRLCINDHIFEQSTGLSSAVFRPLAGEWKRRMEARVTSEKKRRRKRSQDDETTDAEQAWRSLFRELRLLRRLPADSPVLKKWKDHISAMDAGEILPVLELFELAPFTGLQHLTSELLYVFADEDIIADSKDPMQSHHEITIFAKPAMQTPRGSQLVTLGSCGNSQSSVYMRFSPPRTELPREPSQKTLVETAPSEDQAVPTPERVSPTGGEQRLDVHLAAQTSTLVRNKGTSLKVNV
ncbi:hypothetical protein V5O48_013982 [Marasmius crinis-equi]|uniref:Uncharacterized protein n=1 Tax=Marasmius crinis-equi TaxID=585013 RepID=A0ABR3EYK9_9AGAR